MFKKFYFFLAAIVPLLVCSSSLLAVDPPTIIGISPTTGSTYGGEKVTISLTGFTNNDPPLRVDLIQNGKLSPLSFTAIGTTAIDVSMLPFAGSTSDDHTASFKITTKSGAIVLSATNAYTYDPARASITSISPTSQAVGSATITITGHNFLNSATVNANGTPVSASVQSDTSIQTIISSATPQTVKIEVIQNNISTGSYYNHREVFTFSTPAATIATISPRFGPVAGSTPVRITGANLIQGSTPQVFFGSLSAPITNISANTIDCIAPPGTSPGTVAVTVTAAGASSLAPLTEANRYTYQGNGQLFVSTYDQSAPIYYSDLPHVSGNITEHFFGMPTTPMTVLIPSLDSQYLYGLNTQSQELNRTIFRMSSAKGSVFDVFTSGSAISSFAVAPDSRTLFVVNNNNTVTKTKTGSGVLATITDSITTNRQFTDICVSPDGSSFIALDTANNALVKCSTTATNFTNAQVISIEAGAIAIGTRDGNAVWVLGNTENSGYIRRIDFNASTQPAAFRIEMAAVKMALSVKEDAVYVTMKDADDRSSLLKVKFVNSTLSNGPVIVKESTVLGAIALTPDEKTAYVLGTQITDNLPSSYIFAYSLGAHSITPQGSQFQTANNEILSTLAILPDQSPVADFDYTINGNSVTVTSTSGSPVGTIVDYIWTVDGVVQTVHTSTATFSTSNSAMKITLQVTNSQGTSTTQTFTGKSGLNNGSESLASITKTIQIPSTPGSTASLYLGDTTGKIFVLDPSTGVSSVLSTVEGSIFTLSYDSKDAVINASIPSSAFATVVNSAGAIASHPNTGKGAGQALNPPNNAFLAVASTTSHCLYKFTHIGTTSSFSRVTIPVDKHPIGIAFTSDSRYGYVTNNTSGTVSVIDFSNNTVVKTYSLQDALRIYGTRMPPRRTLSCVPLNANAYTHSAAPYGIALSLTNKYACITDSAGDRFYVIDITKQKVTPIFSKAHKATWVVMDMNGKYGYTANANKSISKVDLAKKKVVATVSLSFVPTALALSTDGTVLYIVNGKGNQVVPMLVASNQLQKAIAIPNATTLTSITIGNHRSAE